VRRQRAGENRHDADEVLLVAEAMRRAAAELAKTVSEVEADLALVRAGVWP
jgi:hypothetical protein